MLICKCRSLKWKFKSMCESEKSQNVVKNKSDANPMQIVT